MQVAAAHQDAIPQPLPSPGLERPLPGSILVARYRARGGAKHLVVVQRAARQRWRVVDIGPEKSTVVDVLRAAGDRLAQAHALALDYAREKQAYHAGVRPDDPLPRRRRRPALRALRSVAPPRRSAAPSCASEPRRTDDKPPRAAGVDVARRTA